MSRFIRSFKEINIADIPEVGGKNASLGEMFRHLSGQGIRIPDGFAVTATAFDHFVRSNGLQEKLTGLLQQLDTATFENLSAIGAGARQLFLEALMPDDLGAEITEAYSTLSAANNPAVAVRSSATAEDLPEASFAGQHESFLNITGPEELIQAVRKCFASLYTDRAIKYRYDNGYAEKKIALSVGVQIMVRSDKGSAGVGFTLDPESGFRNVVHLAGIWGLGENIVQGVVTPDEFLVFKPTLEKEKNAILRKKLGKKEKMLVYCQCGSINMNTPPSLQNEFVLSDAEITQIAKWAVIIEKHYGKPMDIEWAKDGLTEEIFIVQARPETVQSRKDPAKRRIHTLQSKGHSILTGQAVGENIATGTARLLTSPDKAQMLQKGDIIVTDITSPDWDALLKKAAAIVTNKGGRTSHAAIVARELGVPAIVGTEIATEKIRDGDLITVACCEGKTGNVYEGKIPWTSTDIDLGEIPMPRTTRPMLIVGDPDKAFDLSFYPNAGVGLMRMEFIISSYIGIHPMALVKYEELQDAAVKEKITAMTRQYDDKRKYFVDRLAAGIATVAAAFYPKPVIVRTSDFKTNEYAHLLGGKEFEPIEENPMLGFRGASRYYNNRYKEGFLLECQAIREVRDYMGLTNVKVMIPFCRTVEEGKKVLAIMEGSGLKRHVNDLEIYVMAEIPSNVLLADEFAEIFDGFSIGSNDLTQLTLGIDRDSTLVANLFSERDEASLVMIRKMIEAAHRAGAPVGLCGQAPSDYPEFTSFLVNQRIDSISFNADAIVKGIEYIYQAEKRIQLYPNLHY